MLVLALGSAPAQENQEFDTYHQAVKHCYDWLRLLRSVIGPPPAGAELRIRGFHQDGSRIDWQVVLLIGNTKVALEYAIRCTDKMPEIWPVVEG